MQAIKVEIFDLSELSEQAQERAHQDYLSNGFEYHWIDESLGSVRAFAALFNATLTDWSLSTCGYSYLKTDIDQDKIRGIKPREIIGAFSESNWLTGYCLDCSLLHGFKQYLEQKPGDVLGAFNSAIDTALTDIIADMEYQESFEAFAESSEANGWTYRENGEFWY